MPHDHEHKEGQAFAPGTRCELCGMLAVAAVRDENGVTHYYCEHHAPVAEGDLRVASQSHGQMEHHAHGRSATGHETHDRHTGHSVNMFRDRFWISLTLTVPILYYSELLQKYLSY